MSANKIKVLLHLVTTKRDGYGNRYGVAIVTNPANGRFFVASDNCGNAECSLAGQFGDWRAMYVTRECTVSSQFSSLPEDTAGMPNGSFDSWRTALRGIGYRFPRES